MKTLIIVSLLALCVGSISAVELHEHNKVVCFWDSASSKRQGPGKFQVDDETCRYVALSEQQDDDLLPVLSLCTHLVYGYAGIRAADNVVVPLDPNLDTDAGYAFYRLVPRLKRSFPNLKVYLSIGGNADPYEKTHKYLTVTESPEARKKFIDSIGRLFTDYDFDGIDLAWQFPEIEVKENRGVFSSLWHDVKKIFGYGEFKDEKEIEHREGFTVLVRNLKGQLKMQNKSLTLTVLPHVNASVYYEAGSLAPYLDAVHLMAFDQKTPERNPKEADYPAPIYGRIPQDNVDSSVRYWLDHGTPGVKIVVGIPTFARTWKLTSDSQIFGMPPIVTDGPGAKGPYTQISGFLSYGEVCALLRKSTKVRRVKDPSKKYGNYAYLPYNSKTGADGIWIGYEDPETAGNKASYAKARGLGGIAIFDLSTDDFHGTCSIYGVKFPIVRAAKYKL